MSIILAMSKCVHSKSKLNIYVMANKGEKCGITYHYKKGDTPSVEITVYDESVGDHITDNCFSPHQLLLVSSAAVRK